MAATLFGALWIGIPLAHAFWLRSCRTATACVIDVLSATFIGDTVAYFGGRPSVAGSSRRACRRTRRSRVCVSGILGGALASGSPASTRTGSGDRRARARRRRGPRGARSATSSSRTSSATSGSRTPGAVRRPRRRAGPPRRRAVHDRRPAITGAPWAIRIRRGVDLPSEPMRRVLILGSTGSIGTQALDVVARSRQFEVVGLAAGLELGAARRAGRATASSGRAHRRRRRGALAPEAWPPARSSWAPRGSSSWSPTPRATSCSTRWSGSAGLGSDRRHAGRGHRPRAGQQGERSWSAGSSVIAARRGTGAQLLPVDSEHSALFQ